jgi:ABC-type transporter Mla MlaB component
MSLSIQRLSDALTVRLDGDATLRDVQQAAAELGKAIEGVSRVTIDASGLACIDASFLQLLCSLRLTVPVLEFAGAPALLLAAAERLGLRRELLGAGSREGA